MAQLSTLGGIRVHEDLHIKAERSAGGLDIMGFVMTVVQIVGIVVTIVGLARFTHLPLWTCFLVGIPLFWGVFFGTFYLLSRRRK